MRQRLPSSSWLAVSAAGLASCGSPGQRMPVNVPEAVAPSEEAQVSRNVGLLLGPDPVASREAAARLESLDEKGRISLAAQARAIPRERDPRWLKVLDANGLLPALTPDERLDYLVWCAGRPEQGSVLRAQAGLLELARHDPDRLIVRLGRPGPGRDAIALALAQARVLRAVPALLELYRRPADVAERRAAAEALATLAGERQRPRVDATEADLAADAGRLEAWWQTTGGKSDDLK